MTNQTNSIATDNVEKKLSEEDKRLIEILDKIQSKLDLINKKDENTLEKLKVEFDKVDLDEVIMSLNDSIKQSLTIIKEIREKFINLPDFAKKYIYSQCDVSKQVFESLFSHSKNKQYFKETFGIINSHFFYAQQFLYRVLGEEKVFNEAVDRFYKDCLATKFEDIDKTKKKAQELLFNIQESYELIKNAQVGSVYIKAFNNYNKNYIHFRKLFYISIALTFSFIIFYGTPDFSSKEKLIGFLIYKVTIFILGGSLIAYFLKLSNFYHLKAEQAYQTHLEIDAFPSYVSGLNPNDILALRKDLAPLYFGKAIDDKFHSGMNNIIQDQVKASTDAIKVATDLIKVSSKVKDPNKPEQI